MMIGIREKPQKIIDIFKTLISDNSQNKEDHR